MSYLWQRRRVQLLQAGLIAALLAGCIGIPQIDPLEQPPHEMGPDHFYIVLGGRQVHYVMTGDGPPIVLLHAGGTSWHDWEGIIPVLARDYTVIAPDMPGAGDSDELAGSHNIENYVAFVESFIEALGLSKTKVLLMGMSFGGMTALEFSLSHQDQVEKLVLLEVSHRYTHPERRPVLRMLSTLARYKVARETVKWWIYRIGQTGAFLPLDLDVSTGLLKSSSRATVEILLSWSEMNIPPTRLRQLKVPTLLLAAENDKEVYASATRELAELLPNAQFVDVPGFNHTDFGKKNLGAGGIVDQSILNFLSN